MLRSLNWVSNFRGRVLWHIWTRNRRDQYICFERNQETANQINGRFPRLYKQILKANIEKSSKEICILKIKTRSKKIIIYSIYYHKNRPRKQNLYNISMYIRKIFLTNIIKHGQKNKMCLNHKQMLIKYLYKKALKQDCDSKNL